MTWFWNEISYIPTWIKFDSFAEFLYDLFQNKACFFNLSSNFARYANVCELTSFYCSKFVKLQTLVNNKTSCVLCRVSERLSCEQLAKVSIYSPYLTKPCLSCKYLLKGQLISKCLFGVFDFSQKTNENKSTWGIIVVKSNFFIRILEELRIPKSPFEINWPFAA